MGVNHLSGGGNFETDLHEELMTLVSEVVGLNLGYFYDHVVNSVFEFLDRFIVDPDEIQDLKVVCKGGGLRAEVCVWINAQLVNFSIEMSSDGQVSQNVYY